MRPKPHEQRRNPGKNPQHIPSPISLSPLRLPFDAELPMPGSKSHANRAIIAACLANGETVLHHATPCDDTVHLVRNIHAMGFAVEWLDRKSGILRIKGGIPQENRTATLECGNAGTTLRFLTALACIVPGMWTITGDAHMRQRPIGDLVRALRSLGVDISDTDGCPPIHVRGGNCRGGTVELDASKSSQFLTALLLIGPMLREGLRIRLPAPPSSPGYIDLTEKVMRDFGVLTQTSFSEEMPQGERMYSTGCTPYTAQAHYAIEGDWSAVGSFLVLAEITGSRIRSPNLAPQSLQSDRKLPSLIIAMREPGDLTIDCTDTPDQLMNLAVLAARREGRTHFTGAGNLRLKECDRLAVLTEELSRAGIVIEEHADGVTVTGSARKATSRRPQREKKESGQTALLNPHDDHRMAMCFAILGCLRPGIRIANPACVAKSYPQFFQDLDALRKNPRCLALVGMRACGKSNLAKILASKLALKRIDTDKVFEKAHGPIGAFVTKHGWESFRREEETIVAENLQPGVILSLGGGAIESAATRQRLQENALTIWMEATPEGTLRRLRKAKRPRLTTLSLEEEVRSTLERRNPLYAEVADLAIGESIPYPAKAATVIRELRSRCSW